MRSVRHWTPRYIVDRAVNIAYGRIHADLPWLTPRANEVLGTLLRPTDHGLEFGSGRSTIWLARHVSRLTSVEHNEKWHAKVVAELKERGLHNADCLFFPAAGPAGGEPSEYARVALRFADDSLDFVLVDGIHRDRCAQLALPKVRSGGLFIVDNVNWFLPSSSRSPNSRRTRDGADGAVWSQVLPTLQNWRRIWTSSGVTDTAIFFKP
jgi:predicted O-methyltransferase YrrM